jgi:hypothetical protein
LRAGGLELVDQRRQLGDICHRAARFDGEISSERVTDIAQGADQHLAERRIQVHWRAGVKHADP